MAVYRDQPACGVGGFARTLKLQRFNLRCIQFVIVNSIQVGLAIEGRNKLKRQRGMSAIERPQLANRPRCAIGEWGDDVTWDGDLELVAGTLHQLAPEQACEVVPTSICEKPIS